MTESHVPTVRAALKFAGNARLPNRERGTRKCRLKTTASPGSNDLPGDAIIVPIAWFVALPYLSSQTCSYRIREP